MKNACEERQTTWQSAFVQMLPQINQRLQRAFRHLDPDAREDSIEEALIHCLLTFARLFAKGQAHQASPSTLCWYAMLAVKRGRPAGNRMNGNEPLSRYAQLSKGIRVEQLHGNWIDLLVEDERASVLDQVAAKLDCGTWFLTLSNHMQQLARELAHGFTTTEVARKHGVSAGRISQVRRTLEASWTAFQHGTVTGLA